MTQFISETRERFIIAIAEQVSADRIAEIHFFNPIKQGGLESGVAVLALTRDSADEGALRGEADEQDAFDSTASDADDSEVEASETGDSDAPTSGANVSAANTSDASTSGANTSDASTSGANTSDASTSGANTSDTNTSDANGPDADAPDVAAADADISASLEGLEDAEAADDLEDLDDAEDSVEVITPAAPARHTVFTAHYRLTLKGLDRGKWQVTVVEEADAPLITVETVVRGVQRRAGDVDEPERMDGDAIREILAAAAARAG